MCAVYCVDCSPGPKYHIDAKMTRFGRDGTPAYSMLGRIKSKSKFHFITWRHWSVIRNTCAWRHFWGRSVSCSNWKFKLFYSANQDICCRFNSSLSIRAAVPDTWTRNIQPWESSTVQPPAETPVLHHALPHSVQKHRLGACSKQVLPPSSHGAPSPKQTVQRELHHVKELQHRGPLCGSGQDARALQVQHHRPEPLPATATGVFHAGTAQNAQRRDPETRAWRVQSRKGDGEQSPGPRLLSGHQTLWVCDPACFECFWLISPIQILQLIKLVSKKVPTPEWVPCILFCSFDKEDLVKSNECQNHTFSYLQHKHVLKTTKNHTWKTMLASNKQNVLVCSLKSNKLKS